MVGVRWMAIEEVNWVPGGASSGRAREKLRAFSVEGGGKFQGRVVYVGAQDAK